MARSGDESLASIYAVALLDLAFQKGVHGEVLAELREFGAILESESQFATFLNTPKVREEAKQDVIRKVFGGVLSDLTLNFLLVTIEKKRQFYLPQILEAFTAGYHERMGELVVDIVSATKLDDKQRDRLRAMLGKKHQQEIILSERINGDLLGGLVIQVGDSRVDGSLRTRLEAVGERLRAARFVSEDCYEN
ncbi:MAG: ATP synthase F1 subunit delta [Planctomycetes bacterium]|nr:ATP synthase F1 subunit delta [Planctomycetota bacterium]